MHGHLIRRFTTVAILMACCGAHAVELPWWVDSIDISPPGTGSIGAVTLSGTWIDTGAPDAIGHSILDGALHFTVSAPDLNVATGDALTPWTLTEEFQFTNPSVNKIYGSIFSVDPANRGNRIPVSVDDFLGWIDPPPRGEFHGLGTGVNSAYVSRAADVSANGRVVTGRNELAPGTAGLLTSEAFAWAPETGRVSLGTLSGGVPGGSGGLGVSADGNYIVGGSTSGSSVSVDREAFRWSFGVGMEGLGTINGASSTSEARATSRNGRVTVGVDDFFPPVAAPGGPAAPFFNGKRAFRHTDVGGMQDLGVLPQYGESSSTEAIDVSADGRVVVGTAERGSLPIFVVGGPIDRAQPFRWTSEDGMVGLGNLPRVFPAIFPFPQQETLANAVSADGTTVVGIDRVLPPPGDEFTLPAASEESAVRWTEDDGWSDLGRLRGDRGVFQSGAEATDVSGEGEIIIGSATISTPCFVCDCAGPFCGTIEEVPFIWDEARGMRPLDRVLADDFNLDFDGWDLGEAAAISDDGTTIVGTGTNPDGFQEAWRAVLHRDTRIGDADFDGDVDTDDYDTIMASLGTLQSPLNEVYYADGDFNADGAIDWDDLDLLLANYDGRSQGDFNADGVVDAADYTLWRDQAGQQTGIADSNGDGWANDADLIAWRGNFGRTLGGGTPVPEPASLMIASLASIAAMSHRVRH